MGDRKTWKLTYEWLQTLINQEITDLTHYLWVRHLASHEKSVVMF